MLTLFLRGVICLSYTKTAVKNVKYHRGSPAPPWWSIRGVAKNQGGGKHRGVPRTPLILTGGWRHPPGPPLKPPLHRRLIFRIMHSYSTFTSILDGEKNLRQCIFLAKNGVVSWHRNSKDYFCRIYIIQIHTDQTQICYGKFN